MLIGSNPTYNSLRIQSTMGGKVHILHLILLSFATPVISRLDTFPFDGLNDLQQNNTNPDNESQNANETQTDNDTDCKQFFIEPIRKCADQCNSTFCWGCTGCRCAWLNLENNQTERYDHSSCLSGGLIIAILFGSVFGLICICILCGFILSALTPVRKGQEARLPQKREILVQVEPQITEQPLQKQTPKGEEPPSVSLVEPEPHQLPGDLPVPLSDRVLLS